MQFQLIQDRAMMDHVALVLDELLAVPDARDVDAESFYRVLLVARGVAAARPVNLLRAGGGRLGSQLLDGFWRLHGARPSNSALAPVAVPGLRHMETTVHALVEILHALAHADLGQVIFLLRSIEL